MSHESRQQKHLAYFQTSPVRGQLEPYQTESRTGWRYLQCTDTPNELKVLLPPRTATLYARLLQLETSELSTGQAANWGRILEIRHLKDRMIRKCHRISRFSTPPTSGSSVQFRIVNAPPDFRLKEMERWLRTNDASNRVTRDTLRRRPSYEGSGTVTPSPRPSRAAPPAASPAPRPAVRTSTSSRKRNSASTQSTHSQPPTVPSKSPYQPSFLSPVPEERTVGSPTPVREPSALPDPFPQPVDQSFAAADHYNAQQPHPESLTSPLYMPSIQQDTLGPTYTTADASVPLADLYATSAPSDYAQHVVPETSARMNVTSPDPIPHPYRPPSGYIQPRHMYDELHDAAMHPPAIGMLPPDMSMPHPVTEMPEPELVPPPEEFGAHLHHPPARVESTEDIEGGRPPLQRRRSGLRSSRNSFSGGKVVSWAMDRDWSEHMTKFDHVVYSAEVAGEELHKARRQFTEEIQSVKNMRENIATSMERLRLETERLQLEERALREHENMMTASFERLREREAAYKDKVTAVLEETKRVVVAADGKRDVQVLG